VGNDRKLYVTTADYQYWYDNDPVGNNSGKVLRVNLDGTRPADNPRADFTWSYGHRNPQGIVCAPNGRIFSSEFGNGNDELNIILRGRDYGWPYFDGDECIFLPDTCNSPTYTYEHAIDVGTNPPSGIDYYESFAIPEFDRSIIEGVVSFNGVIGGIMVYRLNGPQNAVVNKTEYFTGEYGRVRDVCTSPDGKVFFITHDRNNPEIRVLYNPDAHVGLPYQSAGGGLRIYPNPVNDVLTLTAEKDMIGKWELRALTGQVLISGDTFSSQLQVDMKNYSSGIYLLHCGSCVYKIMKE
jgi:glucose/arabinose dehydrogenase